jgi:stage II sporulation protein D
MRRAISLTALTVVCAAIAALPAPARAQIGGPIGAPIVFRPKPGTTLHIEGRGSFHGSIEIRRDGSGVTIVNELDLESYVSGVREVPGLWPMEALKAQSVAARTYAMWEKERGYWQRFGFDVCGTVSCQVYQGADAQLGERGRRWTEGVRATAGEVLLHEGEPALTRYHSSSGGTTLANEIVYPSSGPRPYLRSVDDAFDRVSPLHRWEVNFPRADLERILGHAINLGGTIVDIRVNGREMVIRTQGGELEMGTVRFRREVSESAPAVFPSRYPSMRSDGQRMPATIPSSRFTVRKTTDGFLVQGKGYGHGVGMSQWGAMGRAEEGHTYDEILSAYYTGLRPTPLGRNPTMRVAVVRGVSDVRVGGNGAFGVFTNGQALSPSTLGGWTVKASGERSLQLSPPQGYALPLVLTGVRAPQEQLVDPPEEGGLLHVDVVVPKAAQLTGVLEREGAEVARAKTVVEAGERRLSIPLTGAGYPRRATYRLNVEAFDGTNTVDHSLDVVLTRPPSSLWLRILIGIVLALGLYVVLRRRAHVRRIRRQRRASPEPVRR